MLHLELKLSVTNGKVNTAPIQRLIAGKFNKDDIKLISFLTNGHKDFISESNIKRIVETGLRMCNKEGFSIKLGNNLEARYIEYCTHNTIDYVDSEGTNFHGSYHTTDLNEEFELSVNAFGLDFDHVYCQFDVFCFCEDKREEIIASIGKGNDWIIPTKRITVHGSNEDLNSLLQYSLDEYDNGAREEALMYLLKRGIHSSFVLTDYFGDSYLVASIRRSMKSLLFKDDIEVIPAFDVDVELIKISGKDWNEPHNITLTYDETNRPDKPMSLTDESIKEFFNLFSLKLGGK